MTTHKYSVYGLTVESAIPCPGLSPGEGPTDATVRFGTVARHPEASAAGVLYRTHDGAFVFALDGIARFLVTGGREIIVEPAPRVDHDTVRIFLLGSAFGALLHQRGVLPLHASAVEIDGRCVAFAGPSGYGKSTLAAAFHRRGHPLVSDDVLAVEARGADPPLAYPGLPEIKLWEDALDKLEISAEGLRRIRPELAKSRLPIADRHQKPLPLSRVYLLTLRQADGIEIEPVAGMIKLEALAEVTYRRRFVDDLGGQREHFELCVAVSRHVALRKVSRPRTGSMLDDLVTRIEEDLAGGS